MLWFLIEHASNITNIAYKMSFSLENEIISITHLFFLNIKFKWNMEFPLGINQLSTHSCFGENCVQDIRINYWLGLDVENYRSFQFIDIMHSRCWKIWQGRTLLCVLVFFFQLKFVSKTTSYDDDSCIFFLFGLLWRNLSPETLRISSFSLSLSFTFCNILFFNLLF